MYNFRDYDECNPKFANKAFVLRNLPNGKLSSTQYCAGSSFDGVTTAPGDSGGPSIIREYNDGVQYTLIGIVSGSFSFSDNIYLLIGHDEVIDIVLSFVKSAKKIHKKGFLFIIIYKLPFHIRFCHGSRVFCPSISCRIHLSVKNKVGVLTRTLRYHQHKLQ